ncbi:hypothetical protein E3T35_06180 [Cryobacterium sp. TMT1-2-2]|uniref:hypothetical protein n=1 Tax=Cryobacterium sp. TMT1-2-2 TaxID=1259233 RepID=UPI00106AF435|nr:hypothetical protein [Cryobacterium sp. TMT1-2-2]TFD12873.1 hypothetical protein E3T35_06180 [Cryobacterium sp. TMT1-2-2]
MGPVLDNLRDFCGTYLFWFPDFAQSPGFAGCLAVVAAVIAYIATTKNSRKEQWWKRAEYALNLTLAEEETTQITGLEMLDALESKTEPERAFIKAATQWFLDKGLTEVSAGPADEASASEVPSADDDDAPIPTGSRARIFSAIRGIFRIPRA